MADDPTHFKPKTIQKLLELRFKQDKTRVSSEAQQMTAELLRLFVSEAIHRSVANAAAEGDTLVEPCHLEAAVPQLLLDF
ncbi:hypothetical protein SARC_11287 [Sphaeroforma arctica JP610]|uniref:Centromere protein X n=1 Tax=Sphaeroforma arctica JP610 TaxID=667725 RepID=A0A0L0FJK4_9EUKA|nr:hypothetical protein SARC_11287 [Sphaeroforma arctica JP610]KNC76203.1 hypothetical protein SARC_11287 [Sphaeroforma arctica JP610]|eukprot:XP_014150105.1 hypothetical protein SARC_11287 [Sphaeroforma arctica JP610]